MKFICNWKIDGDKIYVSNDAYLIEGASGLPSLVGALTQEEIKFCHERYIQNRSFAELKEIVKTNTDKNKAYKKEINELKKAKKNGAISIEEFAKKSREIKLAIYC